jgi:hypothetical protein
MARGGMKISIKIKTNSKYQLKYKYRHLFQSLDGMLIIHARTLTPSKHFRKTEPVNL